jgi:hypothetical protein
VQHRACKVGLDARRGKCECICPSSAPPPQFSIALNAAVSSGNSGRTV